MTKKKKEKEVVVDNSWEIKDRQYYLLGGKEPLTYTLSSRHTQRYPLLWFDEEKNEQRALRYATNQNSPFVDEQKGEVTLKHIQFKDGVLNVPKQYQALQKLLSLYHPGLNKKYAERKPVQVAINEAYVLGLPIPDVSNFFTIDDSFKYPGGLVNTCSQLHDFNL